MIRILFLIIVAAIGIPLPAQDLRTENVVIVTLDGYRWREVFGGADKKILFKKRYVRDTTVQKDYWAETAEARRVKLAPFFWNVIGKHGQLYGNREFDNRMRCTNRNYYSYAGYSEMFVGFPDKRINDNDPIENPNSTVMEALNNHHDFNNCVAAFSTWQTMTNILREKTSGVPVNSGSDKADGTQITARERKLNHIVDHNKNPHGDRYDRYTFQYAMEYLKREKPRVTFISFDETDEHAHAGRYDEYLKAAHATDRMISELWSWLQSEDTYRDKTTLIITTDHGRGKSPRGWRGHAQLFRGSAQIWMAILGPDTPAGGEMKNSISLTQGQIAKTIATFLNFPYENVKPVGETIISAIMLTETSEEVALSGQ